jgi:hypothetical protein
MSISELFAEVESPGGATTVRKATLSAAWEQGVGRSSYTNPSGRIVGAF